MGLEQLNEMQTKQLVGVVGAVVMFVGVFCPIEGLGSLGSIGLIGRYDMASIAMLALAVASLVLALLNKCRFLWGTGIGALMVLGATFLVMVQRESFVAENLKWGWLVLFSGAILTAVSAVMEEIELRQ